MIFLHQSFRPSKIPQNYFRVPDNSLLGYNLNNSLEKSLWSCSLFRILKGVQVSNSFFRVLFLNHYCTLWAHCPRLVLVQLKHMHTQNWYWKFTDPRSPCSHEYLSVSQIWYPPVKRCLANHHRGDTDQFILGDPIVTLHSTYEGCPRLGSIDFAPRCQANVLGIG